MKNVNKRLTLKYDDHALPFPDGAFAQIQRKIALFAIAKYFRCLYLDNNLSDLTVTALDPFQTRLDISNQLTQINNIFEFKKTISNSISVVKIKINYLNRFLFCKYYFLSKFLGRNIQLNISNPYPLIEINPKIYIKNLPELKRTEISDSITFKNVIAVHIRRGVSKFHITPGESTPRSLSNDYFKKVIDRALNENNFSGPVVIKIFSDAPDKSFEYKPMQFQESRLTEYARTELGNIKVDGESFSEILDAFSSLKIEIYRGGNPIDAFREMASAQVLIMSRSSLSFVAGLYNKGTIYYPPYFWHKPLPTWNCVNLD